MLYLISTPIGNLDDWSYRAVKTTLECDYLLCEDTRRSLILLNKYEIKKPLHSFHAFNEKRKQDQVIQDLNAGLTIGLLSDAGTPCISDPGFLLVKACHELFIPVQNIPGPCAAISALVSSGIDCSKFQFLGFLPRTRQKIRRLLASIENFEGTTVFYESPFRIAATLKVIAEVFPDRICVVARELTKKFETIEKDTAENLLLKAPTFKGEIVLLISGIEN